MEDIDVLLLILAGAVALYVYSRTDAGQADTAAATDTIAGTVDAVANTVYDFLDGPRGIRNNNPGNIIRTSIPWEGKLTQAEVEARGWHYDAHFEQFDTPEHGLRALGRDILSKYRKGLTSVRAIISVYAPPTENDTEAYIQSVAQSIGANPDDPVDVPGLLPDFAAAIIHQENGVQPYDFQVITQQVYA